MSRIHKTPTVHLAILTSEESFWRSLGCFWAVLAASGKVWEVSVKPPGSVFAVVGDSFGALAAKKLSRIPKDAVKSAPRRPQEAHMVAKGLPKEAPEVPKRP